MSTTQQQKKTIKNKNQDDCDVSNLPDVHIIVSVMIPKRRLHSSLSRISTYIED